MLPGIDFEAAPENVWLFIRNILGNMVVAGSIKIILICFWLDWFSDREPIAVPRKGCLFLTRVLFLPVVQFWRPRLLDSLCGCDSFTVKASWLFVLISLILGIPFVGYVNGLKIYRLICLIKTHIDFVVHFIVRICLDFHIDVIHWC